MASRADLRAFTELEASMTSQELPITQDAVTEKSVLAPSGKSADTENFPVASCLIAREHRPAVMAFYHFARAIDDIADSAELSPEDKIHRLDGFDAAITGAITDDPAYEIAHQCRVMLDRTGITHQHCRDLIDAFRQDAVKTRYQSWDDLIDYCNRSAAPVGRFLLDLHGEDKALYAASDPLCNALQVINHLQDMQEDYRDLNRVYIAEPDLQAAGLDATVLDTSAMPEGLRRIMDNMLDKTDDLLRISATLAPSLQDRRLAMESAAIQALAVRLSQELRRRDPLAERVKLNKINMLMTAVTGIVLGGGLFGRHGKAAS